MWDKLDAGNTKTSFRIKQNHPIIQQRLESLRLSGSCYRGNIKISST
jgi:hypothetical protein